IDELADALEEAASETEGPLARRMRELAARVRRRPDLLPVSDAAELVRLGAGREDLAGPGLYILDLRRTDGLELRSLKAATVLEHVFRMHREQDGERTLVVLEEAQNFAPEQQTGWLSRVRRCSDAVFHLASEGRKFGIGLVIASQRPARVSKDVLSQCNTHTIFRVANVEDLQAIAGSFEAASRPLLEQLPGFDTGRCIVGGSAVGMLTSVQVPKFG
ncbi:MAG: ATP-binding protein, partial [Myxococcales bacterium]